ncbi:response regulator [Runella sp. CRIBMP]|uniref:LytR/AlgR family response regulator transcription factor n=1 Tax=Runella sp. CRIBMP TaxID=2683261 RepID=UPI0014123084|nr:LytTR family DNA-binding domain-containing protein [Runella sp. CRIBMP]NBB22308.1 response regulator [Runella sp. CRIBMP]
MLKVLIIEDDIIWQIKLQVMLEEFEFSILLATSMAEARQLLLSTLPDIILADVRLPDGLAFDFFKVNPPGIPVIFVTEFADKHYIGQTLSIPFSSFYVKPFHPLTLLAAIKGANAAYRLMNDNIQPERALIVPLRYGQKIAIPFDKIHFIEVEGNYSTIQTGEREYVQKLSLSKLLSLLDERFVQIHKSVLVNKDFIQRISLNENTVTIRKRTFEIGRSFRRLFIEKYKEHL